MEGAKPARTSLYDSHVAAGAKLVDFHGFELPIWYTSIQDEHMATRSHAGLFDVSHMGFFRFLGEGVRSWLSSLSTQEYMKFQPGSCGYAHFLSPSGHIIDDMIFAIRSETEVLGVPNSTMREIMLNWLDANLPSDGSIRIEDHSSETSIIALQGPSSMAILNRILGDINSIGRFRCKEIEENKLGIEGWIQGTGYTGEDGVEIFLNGIDAPIFWDAVLSEPDSYAVPVGLGARDTLRLEKGYLLSGQDFLWPEIINDSPDLPIGFLTRNTLETAVKYGLDINHEFIGKEAMLKDPDPKEKWWGLICLERGPSPRTGHAVLDGDDEDSKIIGFVTSGAPSPSRDMLGIAMAYLSDVTEGSIVWLQSSKRRRFRAVVRSPPLDKDKT
tara:strand:+ start:2290 stop:3447 length:1158 start_codon:yes stop_codon:yes gene_type:complete